MVVDSALDALLSPVTLGSLKLRNRVVLPGHTTNFGHGNRPTARHAAYLAERAQGGVGLVITEAIRVHPTSAGRHISLGSFDDDSIEDYASMVSAVHEGGATFFAQIMHAGRQANGDATRTASWSASPIPWTTGAYPPHAMGRADIATVVEAFAAAARRMAAAEFDGLEVHLGHGHLLQQFLSPVTNQRDDGYGGPLSGRIRIVREVLDAIIAAVPDMPIALRISADEFLPGGLDPEQMVEIIRTLTEKVFVPVYVNVSHSAYQASWTLSTQMADMHFDHAQFSGHAAYFKQHVPSVPVLAVCRLDSLAEAAELVAAGQADLVGLVRPHIADPHLVRHAERGAAQPSRSCLACNQACIARVEQSLPIPCVVNPEVGHEAEWNRVRARRQGIRSVRQPERVLVVGAGPAGMEAALAADRGGADVTLVEASGELGGQFARAAALPGRERLGLLTADQVRDVRESGIELRLDTMADEQMVVAEQWHHVIIATGSTPSQRFSDNRVNALTIWDAADVASGRRSLGTGDIVVVDDEGGWTGASLSESLARLGRTVHIVSAGGLASRITTYSRLALLPRLRDLGVKVHLMCSATVTGDGEVTVTHTFNADSTRLSGVTAIVDAGPTVASDALYRSLDLHEPTTDLHIIGDANSPRTALEAVYEGRVSGTFFGSTPTAESKLIASIH